MKVDLSIIVPVYNEEDNARPMFEAIRDAVAPIDAEIELIFVDDGSKDRTVERLMALPRDGKPKLRIVKFRRNYGQTQAMMAGIDVARGRVLVTHISRSFLLPNNLERDLATRIEPLDGSVGDAVADIAPVAVFEDEAVIEGVY